LGLQAGPGQYGTSDKRTGVIHQVHRDGRAEIDDRAGVPGPVESCRGRADPIDTDALRFADGDGDGQGNATADHGDIAIGQLGHYLADPRQGIRHNRRDHNSRRAPIAEAAAQPL
jgi:hypothetical protein